jgi:hypothetical protein
LADVSRYAHEQQKIGDQRLALIKDYAENYDKIDDTQVDSYIQRAVKFDGGHRFPSQEIHPEVQENDRGKQIAKFLRWTPSSSS